jgi:hypothetical protein
MEVIQTELVYILLLSFCGLRFIVVSCRKRWKSVKCPESLAVNVGERMRNRGRKLRRKTEWQPNYLGACLHDLTLAATPKLTRGDFGIRLKKYLDDSGSSFVPDRSLIDTLHGRTYYCLQQLEALRQMTSLVKNKDWKRRDATLRELTRHLGSIEPEFRKNQFNQLPLTRKFTRFALARFRTFTNSFIQELRLAARLTDNERNVVSGYSKPELESQFFLDLDNYLKRYHRSLQAQQRRLIIAGCATVARIVPPEAGGSVPNSVEKLIAHFV